MIKHFKKVTFTLISSHQISQLLRQVEQEAKLVRYYELVPLF